MKKTFMVILFGAMLTLAACGGGDEEASPNESAGGETSGAETTAAEPIYQKSCAGCHGGDLQGGMGPGLTKVGSKYSEEEILNIIHNGQGNMPKGVIQGAEAEAVAAWLAGKK
ncbi:cytochrome c551 [Bacillus suaedaesalsae]|uniref:Cytochrome c n=1 Tax=Bacillus suaedaesalsae TaxID=2810349 RepID=A0ABS2DCY3_9BACI|nr:cytochrome c [Bacillus suaedaesalsae]MBM6616308.1 cytochrome c [Bacillus suaedaesalsae]